MDWSALKSLGTFRQVILIFFPLTFRIWALDVVFVAAIEGKRLLKPESGLGTWGISRWLRGEMDRWGSVLVRIPRDLRFHSLEHTQGEEEEKTQEVKVKYQLQSTTKRTRAQNLGSSSNSNLHMHFPKDLSRRIFCDASAMVHSCTYALKCATETLNNSAPSPETDSQWLCTTLEALKLASLLFLLGTVSHWRSPKSPHVQMDLQPDFTRSHLDIDNSGSNRVCEHFHASPWNSGHHQSRVTWVSGVSLQQSGIHVGYVQIPSQWDPFQAEIHGSLR